MFLIHSLHIREMIYYLAHLLWHIVLHDITNRLAYNHLAAKQNRLKFFIVTAAVSDAAGPLKMCCKGLQWLHMARNKS